MTHTPNDLAHAATASLPCPKYPQWPLLPLFLVAAALAAGCVNLATPYERPDLPVPAAQNNPAIEASAGPGNTATLASATTAPTTPADELNPAAGWARNLIQDPRLQQLVELALRNNRDLQIAVLAIEKARAQYGIEQAGLYPSLAATAAGSRARAAADLTPSGRAAVGSQYTAQLGFASYEIDFFSRIKNLNQVALQEFLRTSENQRSIQLSLVAEVCTAWLNLQADGQRLQLAQDNLRSRQRSYDLTFRSHALGALSGLTLAQTQTTVDTARVDVAAFTSQVERDRNALALLVGAPVPDSAMPIGVIDGGAAPGGLMPDVARAGPVIANPSTALVAISANLPSSVLYDRPDVLAAEQVLRGTYAGVGAARAAFFPSISLTTFAGTGSNSLSGLFGTGNGTWSFAPQIRLPIFDAGRNRAALQVAQANQDMALAQYDKTVQTAFREVADALADRATLGDRLQAQQSLRDASQRVFDLSNSRFKAGVDNYLTVLDAQRSLYSAQQTLISLVLAEQVNRITLFKVLGGAQ